MESPFTRRLNAFRKSLSFLSSADFAVAEEDPFYRAGVGAEFSRTFELGWKAIQAALELRPEKTARGSPRLVIQAASRIGLLGDEAAWLDMLDSRNETMHLYDAELADNLLRNIQERYLPALHSLFSALNELAASLP